MQNNTTAVELDDNASDAEQSDVLLSLMIDSYHEGLLYENDDSVDEAPGGAHGIGDQPQAPSAANQAPSHYDDTWSHVDEVLGSGNPFG